LVAVVQKLVPRIYLPGDYIIVKGQYGKEMYFIRCGECQVISAKDMVICSLFDGNSFGEIALYGKTVRRTATVISSSYCDLDILLKSVCLFTSLKWAVP
jgi:CRP-like cAMP-binding protein